ncbi:hypothetical protein [Allorhizobium terrae]|uniref:Sarcosine oxidase subunit gamma n=1 Tax=Allorhizobium terrae TaxID=1848972 RepID=A0A4S3ZQZ0_9HYPH|nr:hypothetical protein [Allorhizobium terrae]THF47985.1 hypothetical protein E6C51_16055 [Allorhizobium terrae]
MLDRSKFWSAATTVGTITRSPAMTVEVLPAIPQVMISGDFANAMARFDFPAPVGLLAQAKGERYSLRLARNRILVVGLDLTAEPQSWLDGMAMSSMTGALAVIEISGTARMELVARGTAIDPESASPCAALHFAGVNSILYKYDDRLRLHFDRGLVSYMADWIVANDIPGSKSAL